MNYKNLSGILYDIVQFIKTFAAGMKAFINGFKTEYQYGSADDDAATVGE